MAFNAYRSRYNLPAAVAYRLARYAVTHHTTVHDTWMRYDRKEVCNV